jgi:hypothetical protein
LPQGLPRQLFEARHRVRHIQFFELLGFDVASQRARAFP